MRTQVKKKLEGIKLQNLKKKEREVALMLPTGRDCSFNAYQKHANIPESNPAGLNNRRESPKGLNGTKSPQD